MHAETLTIETDERFEMIDLTERVMAIVRGLGVKEGVVNLFSMHTTCTVFINEFQTALLADIRTFLETVVARDGAWRHNDPAHSDCDRMNADSHLRAMLLGHSLIVRSAAAKWCSASGSASSWPSSTARGRARCGSSCDGHRH